MSQAREISPWVRGCPGESPHAPLSTTHNRRRELTPVTGTGGKLPAGKVTGKFLPKGKEKGTIKPVKLGPSCTAAFKYSTKARKKGSRSPRTQPSLGPLTSSADSPHAKAKKLRETAVTKVDKNHGENGERIVLAFKRKGHKAGKATFPGCAGTSDSVVCGGKLNLKHVGRHLSTLVTWSCPTVPPFTCGPGKGGIETKSNKSLGSITLKVQPSAIKKGKRFPTIVKAFAHPHG